MALRLPAPSLSLIAAAAVITGASPAAADGEHRVEGTALAPFDGEDGSELSPAPPDGEDVSEAAAAAVPLPARFEATAAANVRRAPDAGSLRRGLLDPGGVFEATAWAPGPGCLDGWLQVDGLGWTCATWAAPTDRPLASALPLLPFDPPTPEEEATYRRDGTWVRELDDPERLLPFVYGRRSGRAHGRIFADATAAVEGGAPVGRLEPGRATAFGLPIGSPPDEVLPLPDGRIVRLDDVRLYAPSRFQGVPIHGDLPAWVRRGGTHLRDAPGPASSAGADLPARTVLWLTGRQEAAAGQLWLEIAAPGAGWVPAGRVQRVRLLDPPEGADGAWADVDLEQQVLVLRDADGPFYATLVSTGLADATPVGTFPVRDKLLHWDMASLPDAADPYHVEEVPFLVHFLPRYSLHTAFWHDGFGAPRSHGCINLAPRDAAVVFEALAPAMPFGWHSAWPAPDEPRSIVRVHRGR